MEKVRIHPQNRDSEPSSSSCRSSVHQVSPTATLFNSTHTPRSAARSWALIASCTGAMMVSIGSITSVNMVLPTIGVDLNIPPANFQWLISAFSLSSGCLLLLCGRLADLYGRKLVFILGCAVQAIFGLGCGFAKNEITIDILRALQGCGAAATIPAALGILAETFPPSSMRSIAFTIFAAGAPIGAGLGNTMGAVLVQLSQQKWRSVFYLFTGINVLCLVGGQFSMDWDSGSGEKDRRIDYIGAFLATAGITLVIFVLSDGSVAPKGWSTPYIIAFLITGIILIMMFLAWQSYLEQAQIRYEAENSEAAVGMLNGKLIQRRLPPPIMKLSMWRRANWRFAVLQWIAFLNWSSFNAYVFWVQLYYQKQLGLSPILTMVRLLPQAIAGLVCLFVFAFVIGRIDIVYFMIFGTLFTGCSNIFFALVTPSQSYWAYGFPSAIMSVVGAEFVFSGGTLFIAKISLPHEQSVGGALFQTMTQLGTAFGLSITTIIFNSVQAKWMKKLEVPSSGLIPEEASLHAYQAAAWGAFAFGISGTILSAVFLRGVGIIGHKDSDGDDNRNDDDKPLATSDPESAAGRREEKALSH